MVLQRVRKRTVWRSARKVRGGTERLPDLSVQAAAAILFGIKCSLNFSPPFSFPALSVDWHPRHVEVQQEGTAVTVTFDLAPPSLGIRSYFSLCYANGMKKYIDITPVSGPHLHTLLFVLCFSEAFCACYYCGGKI